MIVAREASITAASLQTPSAFVFDDPFKRRLQAQPPMALEPGITLCLTSGCACDV